MEVTEVATKSEMTDPSLPDPELLRQQAEWLSPARSRLFRRVQIARRHRVLDLACGFAAVTEELVRRCGGSVVAVDCRRKAFSADDASFAGAGRLVGDATRLPLADASFDLVFCQLALMWMDAPSAVREIHRVLEPSGALVAIEPDYGGMIEHPAEIATRELWLEALERAGADPCVGRKLPGLLTAAGLNVHVELLDRLPPPSPVRFDLLRDLLTTDQQQQSLRHIEAADAALGDTHRVAHLPMFLIAAEKSL